MKEPARRRWLAETKWLADHLEDPTIRIVDMRGIVQTSMTGPGEQYAVYRGQREEYRGAHIPGAVYLDWTADIIDFADPVPAQVAPPERIAAVFGKAGIGDDTTVVAYDTHPASQFATRLWWVLCYYGHDKVKVLNGGLPKWQREGRPLSGDIPTYPPAIFTPQPRPAMRATAAQVLAALGQPNISIADARDADQYDNRLKRGKRGGHIPGAIHLPREAFFDELGCFRTQQEIADEARAAGLSPTNQVIAYCNGGVAATSVLFCLNLLGYQHLTNYDGSWNEWSNRAELPVES